MSEKRILIIAVLALAVTYGGYQAVKSANDWMKGFDYSQYYVASRMVLAGESEKIYLQDKEWMREAARYGVGPAKYGSVEVDLPANVYPPVVSIMMIPFALLPYETSRYVFFAFNYIAAAAVVALLFANRRGERKRTAMLIAACAFLIFYPFHFALYFGQINIILLLLCALGLYFARKERYVAAGIPIGLAAAVKFFPAILALFFLLKRRPRGAISTIAAAFAFTLASLYIYTPAFLFNYFTKVLPSQASAGASLRNQSITGFFSRLLTSNTHTLSVENLPALATVLSLIISLLVLFVLCLFVFKNRRAEPGKYGIEFAAFLVAGVIVTPKSWTHLAVFLLPAWFFAADWMRAKKITRAAPWFFLFVSYCIWAFTFTGIDYETVPPSLASTFAVSTPLYASLILLIVLLWVIRREPRRNDAIILEDAGISR